MNVWPILLQRNRLFFKALMPVKNEEADQLIFEEVQKLRNLLIWIVMGGVLVLLVTQLIYELTKTKPDTSGVAVLIAILCIYFIPVFLMLFYARLTVRIDEKGISYGWNLPTKDLNFIPRENIRVCEVITHPYIGAGYKMTKKYGIVYNTQGRQGLQVITQGGEKILLGTQKPAEMKQRLTNLGILTG